MPPAMHHALSLNQPIEKDKTSIVHPRCASMLWICIAWRLGVYVWFLFVNAKPEGRQEK